MMREVASLPVGAKLNATLFTSNTGVILNWEWRSNIRRELSADPRHREPRQSDAIHSVAMIMIRFGCGGDCVNPIIPIQAERRLLWRRADRLPPGGITRTIKVVTIARKKPLLWRVFFALLAHVLRADSMRSCFGKREMQSW